MSDRIKGERAKSVTRERCQEDGEAATRAAKLLVHAEAELGVLVQEIPLDAIEPDPAQPRRVFDEEKLRGLAASIQKHGLLQEPGVVAVAGGDGASALFRLIWGERRWRAARLAGLTAVRCKVLPRADGIAVEQLRTRERQWAENMEREGLSPVEEAIAIQDAADAELKARPDAFPGELIENVGAERGLNGIVARNLVGLLKTPHTLQAAMLNRTIGREVGFELARHWNKLRGDAERGSAKREFQYRKVVEDWARSRGMDLDAQAMTRYAAETFQDPKVVKATCRKAEESQQAILGRFDAIVARAQKEGWTVGKAKAELGDRRRRASSERSEKLLPCFEQGGKDKARLTVHLDRVRDPTLVTPEELDGLLSVLRDLVREVESVRLEGGPGPQTTA